LLWSEIQLVLIACGSVQQQQQENGQR